MSDNHGPEVNYAVAVNALRRSDNRVAHDIEFVAASSEAEALGLVYQKYWSYYYDILLAASPILRPSEAAKKR